MGTGHPEGIAMFSIADYERDAARLLDPALLDFLNGGAVDGRTVQRNRTGYERLLLNAFRFVDVSARSTATEVLGQAITSPVIIAPTGLHGVGHPEGELATARAAARAGTIMTTGTMATASIEEIAAVAGPRWFQVYNMGRPVIESFVRRAETAGYSAIIVTVDVPVQVRGREQDRRNGFRASKGQSLANFDVGRGATGSLDEAELRSWKREPLRPVTLNELGWLRALTDLPLVAKGIMTAKDAAAAVDAGCDAIVVSNHGGREGDALPGTIEVLAEIVDTVAGRAEVYLDGGIRRGTDVVKALAIGARAVLIGRPFWWGLAVAGEDGVFDVLEMLRTETEEALVSVGCPDVRALDRSFVRAAGAPILP